MSRRAETRDRIQQAAMDLFDERGYEGTPVAAVAAHAGVSEMTVFRHFPTKAALAVDDPFDPRIVDAIAAQALDVPALDRLLAAMASAVAGLEDHHDALAARRARLVASTPVLLGAVAANNAHTQELMARQLEDDGADPADAVIAAAAVLAAVTAALLASAHDSTSTVKTAVGRALAVLGREP